MTFSLPVLFWVDFLIVWLDDGDCDQMQIRMLLSAKSLGTFSVK